MPVKIRLKKIGRLGQKHYRMVIVNEQSKRDGKVLDVIGNYIPHKKKPKLHVDQTKIEHWLNRGAVMTETVKNILKK